MSNVKKFLGERLLVRGNHELHVVDQLSRL